MTRAWRSWWVPAVALVALLGSLAVMLGQGGHAGAWDRSWERDGRDDFGHHRSMMDRDWRGPGSGTGPESRQEPESGQGQGPGSRSGPQSRSGFGSMMPGSPTADATPGAAWLHSWHGGYVETTDAP